MYLDVQTCWKKYRHGPTVQQHREHAILLEHLDNNLMFSSSANEQSTRLISFPHQRENRDDESVMEQDMIMILISICFIRMPRFEDGNLEE